jgi:hypothetical protein
LNRQQDLALLALCGKQNTKGLSSESDTNFVNVTSQVPGQGEAHLSDCSHRGQDLVPFERTQIGQKLADGRSTQISFVKSPSSSGIHERHGTDEV